MAESQVTPTHIEMSNQRAAELTAARVRIARLRRRLSLYQAENARMRAHAEMALNEVRTADAHALVAALLTEGEDDEITRLRERIGEVIGARGLEALSAAALGVDPAEIEVSNERAAQATQSTDPEPFTGQGNRLGE